MRVLFRTDSSVSGDGFRARWTRNCGGELDGVSGVVTSPGYPDVYPRLQHCEYVIRGGGQLLTVNFTMFSLEKSVGSKLIPNQRKVALNCFGCYGL